MPRPDRLVIATRNRKKLAEMAALLADLGIEVRCAADFPGLHEVVEDGDTFEANAAKKAVETARFTGWWAVADDSGIEVDALGGRPGVYSARYAGPGADDEANNEKMLGELAGVPPERRTARYRCVIVLADPTGKVVATTAGAWEGRLLESRRGAGGFGYDPLFLIPSLDRTVAEIPAEQKNRLSHRGQALAALKALLAKG